MDGYSIALHMYMHIYVCYFAGSARAVNDGLCQSELQTAKRRKTHVDSPNVPATVVAGSAGLADVASVQTPPGSQEAMVAVAQVGTSLQAANVGSTAENVVSPAPPTLSNHVGSAANVVPLAQATVAPAAGSPQGTHEQDPPTHVTATHVFGTTQGTHVQEPPTHVTPAPVEANQATYLQAPDTLAVVPHAGPQRLALTDQAVMSRDFFIPSTTVTGPITAQLNDDALRQLIGMFPESAVPTVPGVVPEDENRSDSSSD